MVLDAKSRMVELGQRWSVEVSDEAAERLVAFCSSLLTWNKTVNLTGASSVEELVTDHLPDSFAAARLIPPCSSVVDVGAGGGLPGLPFAILRGDCQVTMVEPRSRRVAFLNRAVRVCGCAKVRVVRGRSEDLVGSRFDVAMSRATFAPKEWLEIAAGLVVPNGKVVVFSTSEVAGARFALVAEERYGSGSGSSRWCGLFSFA